MVDAGFEPAKAEPLDLQSSPVDRLGNPPTESEGFEPSVQVLPEHGFSKAAH
jgi:hypothetical protein